MGLRETKAARTRARVIAVALDLFEARGFEATTTGEIAERAEIGSSTLFRHFASKDLILLDPFTRLGLADAVRARPAGEPVPDVLGHVVRDRIAELTRDPEPVRRASALIDRSPGPRARLWDVMAAEMSAMEAALAGRLGRAADDAYVAVLCRVVVSVLDLTRHRLFAGGADASAAHGIARTVVDELRSSGLELIRWPDDAPPSA